MNSEKDNELDTPPTICPFCGGIKSRKRFDDSNACPCTCRECSDGKEYE